MSADHYKRRWYRFHMSLKLNKLNTPTKEPNELYSECIVNDRQIRHHQRFCKIVRVSSNNQQNLDRLYDDHF
jgi:hypothetical protein